MEWDKIKWLIVAMFLMTFLFLSDFIGTITLFVICLLK